MISLSQVKTGIAPASDIPGRKQPLEQRSVRPPQKMRVQILSWFCLLLTCVGVSWFVYQWQLVPQPRTYAPDWHDAQWIQAPGAVNEVAYFRSIIDVGAAPDTASITVAASQRFYVYINGTLVGSNDKDFKGVSQAYMYDVTAFLLRGTNVIAVRVDNLDDKQPLLRLNTELTLGNNAINYGTNSTWRATSDPGKVYLHRAVLAISPQFGAINWTQSKFSASLWTMAQQVENAPFVATLSFNPQLYESAITNQWISTGGQSEGYFVRSIFVSSTPTEAWLRLVADGQVDVFINGNQFISANYQPLKTLPNGSSAPNNHTNLIVRVYNVTPYMQKGQNTLAIHVVAPATRSSQDDLANMSAALSTDMLVTDVSGHTLWFDTNQQWHASHQPVAGWMSGSEATQAWASPVLIAPSSRVNIVYVPNVDVAGSTTVIPSFSVESMIFFCCVGVIALWLLLAAALKYLFRYSWREASRLALLSFLPALSCEMLLLAISMEPTLPSPFPYTGFWAAVLLLTVVVGFGLVIWHGWSSLSGNESGTKSYQGSLFAGLVQLPQGNTLRERMLRAGGRYWAVLPLVLIGIPLIFYNLGYEPYWQDELTSYFVAKHITMNGLPCLPSGFLYPKGELFSYILAGVMLIFGDQAGIPRVVSATEYILTIPLLYYVGSYFFNRRVAWLAAAMLTFSPVALTWGRQVRMYQQAQFLALLVFYLFYRAIQEQKKTRYLYLATAALIAAYFSHEEIFICMPALVICILVASWQKTRLLPSVMYQKRWWYAGVIAACIIGVQLVIVHVSHPPVLGSDASQRPPLQLTTDNMPYYFYLLFFPAGNDPGMTGTAITGTNTFIVLNSLLMVLGSFLALKSKDMRKRYCGLFFVISFATLLFVFTMQADRYFYPLLTLYYLLGAYALMQLCKYVQVFVRSCAVRPRVDEQDASAAVRVVSQPMKGLMGWTVGAICLCVLLVPMFPLSSYNLFVSRATGLTYYHHYERYDAASDYIRTHWQKGDIVISIVPDQLTAYYLGHTDYFILMDHALFLFEDNGHIVDTYTGNPGLFRQSDLNAVLNAHGRVWLMSANNYYQSTAFHRLNFPPDFRTVYVGSSAIVYLRGS